MGLTMTSTVPPGQKPFAIEGLALNERIGVSTPGHTAPERRALKRAQEKVGCREPR
jgi:hypothetical protein